MTIVRGVLDGVGYHQFFVVADADQSVVPQYVDDDVNGLIAPTGHAVCVQTGIAMGVIRLEIEVLDGPAGDALDERVDWAAVSEVSFEATSPTARVEPFEDWPSPAFDAPIVLASGVGWYRVRAHAMGRELDFDAVVDVPRERHLLQLWRTDSPQPARHHRIDNPWANQSG